MIDLTRVNGSATWYTFPRCLTWRVSS